ncbi:hypothetical protein [Sulfurospirillum arcachonense]|uniref:hypothetical protein n=1 Tax=Sulfurospirillum arcachonense TaxID=57666 RepID=UPI00046A1EAF|nr:hypothetical protein [Sulfurospirillum arcachonense]
MNLLTNSKLISLFWWIFAPVVVAKLFLSVGAFFLDTNTYEPLHVKKTNTLHIYNLPKFYKKGSFRSNTVRRVKSFKNMHLKACYIESGKKFIVVEENKKVSFINLEEEYKGAKLIEVHSNAAVFMQQGKNITLSMQEDKSQKNSMKIYKDESNDEKYINIKKEDFQKYIKNPKEVVKDIRIREIIQDNSFEGLKITFLRKGSLFDTMSLKKEDIIKTINDKNITGTISLMPYYNNLKNSSALKIGLQRDGKMKEIVYEID